MVRLFFTVFLVFFINGSAFAENLTFDIETMSRNKVRQLNANEYHDPAYSFPWTTSEFQRLLVNYGLSCEYWYARNGANEGINPYIERENYNQMTQELWDLISSINYQGNTTITSDSDLNLYGHAEWWAHPKHVGMKGDCEDYAIWKRRELMKHGVRSYFVTTWIGVPHAILLVRTTHGDYYLDVMVYNGNYTHKPVRVNEYPYTVQRIETVSGVWYDYAGVEQVQTMPGAEYKIKIGAQTTAPAGWSSWISRGHGDGY